MERKVIKIDITLTDKMFMADVLAVMVIMILLLIVKYVIYSIIDLFNWIKEKMKKGD